MNGVPDIDSTDARLELMELFLRRTRAEVEQMRRSVPKLIEGDDHAWRDLHSNSERISSMAGSLKLEVLSAHARELCDLAEGRQGREHTDTMFLLDITRAIEVVAIDLNQLFGSRNRR